MSSVSSGSFRDPSGFIFYYKDEVYRQVNTSYKGKYESLFRSGLYDELTSGNLLIKHSELGAGYKGPKTKGCFKIIKPEPVPFISYPYEWSFGMFKDAALLTLKIQKHALARDLSLKDASAYNIQFLKGKPILIDTLSFEKYTPGEPWVAYRQFCQHFLAPLSLMSYVDVRLNLLLREYVDGIPLDLASKLLPTKSKLKLGLLLHLHTHAKAQAKHESSGEAAKGQKISKQALLGILDSLEKAIKNLHWEPKGTQWGEYYSFTNYKNTAFRRKNKLVETFVKSIKPKTVWDLGANTGVFSNIAAKNAKNVVAFDIDPAAVEKNYQDVKKHQTPNVLPLVQDLTNPSPGIGWAGDERDSLDSRGPADLVMALALIHHLRIGNNVPLKMIARFFSKLGPCLIIEYVPKADSQVQKLLASREDIFADYTESEFEAAFKLYYRIVKREPIKGTKRTLYLMKVKNGNKKR